MHHKEKHTEKKYYTIGEVAKQLGIATSMIRFWEQTFPTLCPKKNKQGIRKYSQADIVQLRRIYALTKEQGYTLKGAKKILCHYHNKPQNDAELIQALQEIKAFLVALKEKLT